MTSPIKTSKLSRIQMLPIIGKKSPTTLVAPPSLSQSLEQPLLHPHEVDSNVPHSPTDATHFSKQSPHIFEKQLVNSSLTQNNYRAPAIQKQSKFNRAITFFQSADTISAAVIFSIIGSLSISTTLLLSTSTFTFIVGTLGIGALVIGGVMLFGAIFIWGYNKYQAAKAEMNEKCLQVVEKIRDVAIKSASDKEVSDKEATNKEFNQFLSQREPPVLTKLAKEFRHHYIQAVQFCSIKIPKSKQHGADEAADYIQELIIKNNPLIQPYKETINYLKNNFKDINGVFNYEIYFYWLEKFVPNFIPKKDQTCFSAENEFHNQSLLTILAKL